MDIRKDVFPNVCRIILAATFIFSGFVKTIDPWGTAIKIGEYLSAFHVDWLLGGEAVLGIWLCAAELMLGCMLMFKVRLRLISIFAVVSMLIFTTLTLVLAVTDPIEDCGCFGEAIKMTNWQSFFKNLVLLPMSIVVWRASQCLHFFPFTLREALLTVLFAALAGGLGIWCWHHLPLIDFLPYKVGVDLRLAHDAPSEENLRTTLVYRDLNTGREREFEVTDTAWYDSSRWEYVDTRIEGGEENFDEALLKDFTVFDSEGEITDEILGDEGTTYLVCALRLEDIKPWCKRRLEALAARASAEGARMVCVTSSWLGGSPAWLELDGYPVRCYNMDVTVLKSLMRARVGVVTLCDGVIADKRTCHDVRR